jgi:hypothetical protein
LPLGDSNLRPLLFKTTPVLALFTRVILLSPLPSVYTAGLTFDIENEVIGVLFVPLYTLTVKVVGSGVER